MRAKKPKNEILTLSAKEPASAGRRKAQQILEECKKLPRYRRQQYLLDQISRLPPAAQQFVLGIVGSNVLDPGLQPWEKTLMFSGVALVILIVATAFFLPYPSPFQGFVFRTALALGAAAIAYGLSGMLAVEAKANGMIARATGSSAVFLLVFFFTPKEFPTRGSFTHTDSAVTVSQQSKPRLLPSPSN